MAYRTQPQESFTENLPRLKPEAQRDVGRILKALEQDCDFCPSVDEGYIVEVDPKGLCACRHPEKWDDCWQLTWHKEVGWGSQVEVIYVRLDCVDLTLVKLEPRRRSL